MARTERAAHFTVGAAQALVIIAGFVLFGLLVREVMFVETNPNEFPNRSGVSGPDSQHLDSQGGSRGAAPNKNKNKD